MAVIIAKNQTAGILAVNDLSITNQEIPASGQVTLTDFATLTEIQNSNDVLAHVNAGDLLLELDGVDLGQSQSACLVKVVSTTLPPPDIERGLISAADQDKINKSENDLVYSFKDQLKSNKATYEVKATLFFRGTDALGTPTNIKAIAAAEAAAEPGDLKIYDSTNSQTIAELTGISNLTRSIQDMGALTNLPAGESVWEVQLRVPLNSDKNDLMIYAVAVLF